MTASTAKFVLPGDLIPQESLPIPSNSSIPLKLGPGLQHTPPSTVTAVLAGSLCIDTKKKAIWVENNTGRVLSLTLNLTIPPFLYEEIHPAPLMAFYIQACAHLLSMFPRRMTSLSPPFITPQVNFTTALSRLTPPLLSSLNWLSKVPPEKHAHSLFRAA